MGWLDKTPLRWLLKALVGAVLLAVLQVVAGAILKAASAPVRFNEYGVGDGWSLRTVAFLLAFPLGAEVLGLGGTGKALARLLVLAVGVSFVCAQLVGSGHLLDGVVLLLAAAAAMASAIEGRARYLYGLGLGLLVVLTLTGARLIEDFSGKNVLTWLMLAVLVHGPTVVVATFLATDDTLHISLGKGR